jgi:hypothetical protein
MARDQKKTSGKNLWHFFGVLPRAIIRRHNLPVVHCRTRYRPVIDASGVPTPPMEERNRAMGHPLAADDSHRSENSVSNCCHPISP